MEEFRILLKKHSLKATPQRLAVHQAMMNLGHASVDMVTEHVLATGTKVTTASVYNILSQRHQTSPSVIWMWRHTS